MFNGQKQTVDKVNMSLDDIIKMNKKQHKKPGNNNNNNNNRLNNNSPKKSNFNKKPNRNVQQNNQQGQRQGNRRPRPNNKQGLNTNKPFGILNRSKSIQKNRRPNNNKMKVLQNNQQQNKPVDFVKRRPQVAKFIANRRRVPNNKVKRANNNNNKPKVLNTNRLQNRRNNAPKATASQVHIIKPAASNFNSIKKSPMKQQRQNAQATKSKIAMQSARKNIQKAKKLLISKRKPTKQLMTQKYAAKLGLAAATSSKTGLVRQRNTKSVLKQPKKVAVKDSKPRMLKVNIANKVNKIRKAKVAQQQTVKRVAANQVKKPIINRSRPLGGLAGKTSNRMVFLK